MISRIYGHIVVTSISRSSLANKAMLTTGRLGVMKQFVHPVKGSPTSRMYYHHHNTPQKSQVKGAVNYAQYRKQT